MINDCLFKLFCGGWGSINVPLKSAAEIRNILPGFIKNKTTCIFLVFSLMYLQVCFQHWSLSQYFFRASIEAMIDRASRLIQGKIAQHASLQRKRSQVTQPTLAFGQAVPEAQTTTSSSGVPPATLTTSAFHSRRDSSVHPSPLPSSRRRTSPPPSSCRTTSPSTTFETGEASGSQATPEVPEAQSQPQSESAS